MLVGRHVDAANIGGNARRAIDKGGIAQFAHQGADRALVQFAGVELTRDREGDGQDRCAERVFLRPRNELLGQTEKGMREFCRFRRVVWHDRDFARHCAIAARPS